MENPSYMEVYSWENHLFLWAMASMAMLNNQRVNSMVPVTTNQRPSPVDPRHLSISYLSKHSRNFHGHAVRMTPWRRGRPAAGQGLKGRGDAKNGARLVADLDEKSG